MSLKFINNTQIQDERDLRTIREYEAEMRRRDEIDKRTPRVQFYNGTAYVDKRPMDGEVVDGKKQRVFYQQSQVFGKLASQQSANAVLLQKRPIETREFPDTL